MANWCSNNVVFAGKDDDLYTVFKFFEALRNRKLEEAKAIAPGLAEKSFMTFCGIEINGDVIEFETQYQPNIALLVNLSNFFDISFLLQYDECVEQFYGQAVYSYHILTICEIPFNTIYEYETGKEQFNYNGMHFDFAYDLLDVLVDEKIKESISPSSWNPIHFS